MGGPVFMTSSILSGVVQIGLMALVGAVFVRRRWFPEEALQALARLVIDLTLPSLILVRFAESFSTSALHAHALIPFFPFLLALLALVALVPWWFLPSVRRFWREVLALTLFQNAGYLPLTLAVALFPQNQAEAFQVAVFFFVFTASPFLWSVGVMLLSGKREIPLTPPFLAVIVGIGVALTGVHLPGWIRLPLEAFGEATIPLGMFLVGGYLAGMVGGIAREELPALFAVSLTKALILPLLVAALLRTIALPSPARELLWMEALMPSAVNTVVIAARYGGNVHLTARGVFFTHLLSLVVIPALLPWGI